METPGHIILVPTPIGNLGDITLRALEILKSADRIACEDTRHSGQLLAHHGISGKPLVSLHEHNEVRRAPELVAAARTGETIAVISDADMPGIPGIPDPGYRLMKKCLSLLHVVYRKSRRKVIPLLIPDRRNLRENRRFERKTHDQASHP